MDWIRRGGLILGVILILGLIAKFVSLEPMNLKEDQGEVEVRYVSVSPVEYDFFAEYRLQREIIRSKEIDLLQEMINNNQYDPEIRQKAQVDLLNVVKKMEKELECENLIKAKGAKDSLVIIGEDGVNVVVKVEGSMADHVSKIGEATARVTGRRIEDISIIAH